MPRRDAHATEDVPTRTLDGRVEHALADAAHQVGVRRRVEQIDVVPRHLLSPEYCNEERDLQNTAQYNREMYTVQKSSRKPS